MYYLMEFYVHINCWNCGNRYGIVWGTMSDELYKLDLTDTLMMAHLAMTCSKLKFYLF